MQPTMRQLEVFVAVARAGSFRRAAERLHLSQPALSQHVAELERGLGARVFDRRGRQIALTEAGRILEDHAHRVFATLHGAEEAIAELAGGTRGALVIGASTTPGIYVLPALMSRFERGQPGISVALRIANSRVIEEQVRANELDLGVVGGHGLRPGEACLAAGVLDELVLIVPPGHAWARQNVKPGVRELAVYAGVAWTAYKTLGHWAVVYGDFAVTNGTKRGGPPSARVLKKGETFILDYSVIVHGYRSDFTNTLVVGGEPSEEQQKLFGHCAMAMEAGERELKAGAACQTVYDAIRGVFAAADLADFFTTRFCLTISRTCSASPPSKRYAHGTPPCQVLMRSLGRGCPVMRFIIASAAR